MLTLAAAETLSGKAGTGAAITYTVFGDAKTTSDAFQKLAQGVLGTSAAAPLYTVGGSTAVLVSTILLANTTGSNVSGVTFYVGGSAAGNQLWSGMIPANGSASYGREGWKVYDSNGQQLLVGGVGPTGTAATIAPGTTTTVAPAVSASVTNSGSSSAAVFDFSIPRGSQWVVTVGVPGAGVGSNGDYALNSSTGDVYGPKAAGAWGSIVANIKGTTGSPGAVNAVTALDGSVTVAGTTNVTVSRAALTGDVTAPAGSNATTIAPLAVTDAKVAAANKDGAAATPSMRTLGTGAQQATAGNDSRLSDARTPSGTAGGDLTGTYPNPTLPTSVNANPGTAGSGTAIPVITTNNKGQVTAVTTAALSAVPTARLINTTAPLTGGGDLTVDRTLGINAASAIAAGSMSATHYAQAIAQTMYFIFVTANPYSNLKCDGATDDLAALNALYSGAPDGSILVWPGQNSTTVLSNVATVPSGKHFVHQGGGPGNKTNILQISQTADHFSIAADWYSTWTGFNFTTNNTTTTGVQALTSGTVLNVGAINTALVAASGSINVGSATGWQVLTYSARTSTTVTLSSTGTGNSVAGAPLVFKTAGAAINAGNLVGIDAISNSFSYCFNGYVAAGSTSNQSRIVGNGFLNTINFDVWIDSQNWNGIIDSNTADCTTTSRSVSHCEITQCGSLTGQGNQFIRGQYNLRVGSTTAAYPAGAFGVYFSNCFFDNAGIDAIKFQGISAIQRVKITASWISSAAQKGVNFASTASTLPSDIEFVGCNVYANGTDGFGGSGYLDYKVVGGQVAGNVGSGFNVAAPAGGNGKVDVLGARIGPVGGFGANGVGITIAAGTYGAVKFRHCDTAGNTTALSLGAVTITGAVWSQFAITDCPGINPKGAVTPPIATPVSATTYTNSTGFKCAVQIRTATLTTVTVNGVANTGTATSSSSHQSVTLDPGATIALTATTPTWAWSAM